VERPRNGAPGNLFYQFHEVVGLTMLGVVSTFWVLARRGETSWAALFPWFLPARLRALAADLARHWAALHQFVGQPILKRIFGRGDVLGVDRFGASAPSEVVMREYGFTVDNVCRRAVALVETPR